MKYSPSRDLPEFAREAKTLSPSILAEIILNKRNEKVSPESVTMWFKRHSEVYEALKAEIVEQLPTETSPVEASTFQNGMFENLRSVKEYILYMKTRRHKGKPLKQEYVDGCIRYLRYACNLYHKHPDRLTYRDCQEIFLAMENDQDHERWEGDHKVKGRDTFYFRTVLKNFLKSKGSPEWEKIGVGKISGFAHYKTLFVEKSIVLEMLEWMKARDFRAYVVDKIMYHNGLRISAVLKAQTKDFKEGEKWAYLKVLEKFREEKTFMLLKEVGSLIKQVIGDRKDGLIFERLEVHTMAEINREVLKKYVPELEPKIEMPNHFFRHMCAQHLLRATNWNSKAVAAIMQCTEQSLNESYGGAPEQQLEEWCIRYLPMLGA